MNATSRILSCVLLMVGATALSSSLAGALEPISDPIVEHPASERVTTRTSSPSAERTEPRRLRETEPRTRPSEQARPSGMERSTTIVLPNEIDLPMSGSRRQKETFEVPMGSTFRNHNDLTSPHVAPTDSVQFSGMISIEPPPGRTVLLTRPLLRRVVRLHDRHYGTDQMSREELYREASRWIDAARYARTGARWGGRAGPVVGAVIGSVAGPKGAVVGAAVGRYVGPMVGAGLGGVYGYFRRDIHQIIMDLWLYRLDDSTKEALDQWFIETPFEVAHGFQRP